MSAPLRERIGYAFRDPDLLRQALTHRSFSSAHNERLEFVGDAVLNCVIGLSLYERFPALDEGELSRIRASLVSQPTLAAVARRLDLAPSLRLGDGEMRSGGADRSSILADALEAVFGGVFLDGGFDAARAVVTTCFGEVLSELDPAAQNKDPKTRLQELLQARRLPVPEYAVHAVSGEPHAQSFEVECRIPSLEIVTRGTGGSRRAAEQAAAQAAERLAAGADGGHRGGG